MFSSLGRNRMLYLLPSSIGATTGRTMVANDMFHKSLQCAFATTSKNTESVSTAFPTKVAVVGAGSFGSAMTRIIAKAISPDESEQSTDISWYARRSSIVEEINTQRTNSQYLPGAVFPSHVKATSNLQECIDGAGVIVLAIPTGFLPPLLEDLQLSPNSVVVSVLKSLKYSPNEQKMVTSVDIINQHLSEGKSNPPAAVVALSGPNLYREMVSDEEFAEATIGYDDDNDDESQGNLEAARLVQRITSSSCFQTSLTNDRVGVELCGGLKNVFSLAVGYMEGLDLGWNARSAAMRAGQHEMARFMNSRGMGVPSTVFETSAGVGDLVLTCTAGRGRTLAAAFVKEGLKEGFVSTKDDSVERWEQLENTMLNGMKLPDWHNAQYVHQALVDWNLTNDFPLLEAVYQIGFEGQHPRTIVDALSRSIVVSDYK